MKFMKLGSKADSFRAEGNNVRYVASELATDVIVNVGDAKFYLHKFPLLSKSARLQKLVAAANDQSTDEVHIPDIPGGPAAFELCTKFCYGMTVTLNAYNVVGVRCAAEYLEMHETIEKGNLIYKVDVFLNSSIFHSWKDSIVVLQSMKPVLQLSEELKLVNRCIESISTKACVNVSSVDWSYAYNRKKLPEERGNDQVGNVIKTRHVPSDWWVEDLCELEIDFYKRIITNIKSKAVVSNEVIGEALKAYTYRNLSGFSKAKFQSGEVVKYRLTVDAIVWLLPAEKGTVSCSFLLKLLKAAIFVDSGDSARGELIRRIGKQLEEASVNDLLISTMDGEATMYDVFTVQNIVREFLTRDKDSDIESEFELENCQEMRKPGILSDASKLMVVKLVDGYLAEIAKDPGLPISEFVGLAETVSCIPRPSHDKIYRAIDMFLKEHPGISKSERKRICKLMDCKKLSPEACMHAVQNERLPLRVVVQVLFFEQVRASASSGASTPDLPKGIRNLNNSHRSPMTATAHADEDWDAVATAEELKALKSELASLRLSNAGAERADKAVASKMRGLIMSRKIFTRIWSARKANGSNSGSDSSDSLGSTNHDEGSRNGRNSVS